uniref:Protein kinase domain-containing protein n=1 Tax=Monopterus albus TaxID=43700 RepID=A0A3Q3JJG7_MONAL
AKERRRSICFRRSCKRSREQSGRRGRISLNRDRSGRRSTALIAVGLHPSRPVIGTGSFGVVYRVKSLRTQEEFALKCHACKVDDSTVRELSCLAALRGHPNIIQLLDCFVSDEDRMAMLMPCLPFTLSCAIYTSAGVPLSFVASFSRQTANALAYVHRLNLVHRDIAPNNLLLAEDLTVKVADFGLARQVSKRMSLNVVTEPYRAPEIFAARSDYTCAIDMWSLGAVIADAMESKVTFLPPPSTLQMITELAPDPGDLVGDDIVTRNREKLMPKLMRCEPVKRISLERARLVQERSYFHLRSFRSHAGLSSCPEDFRRPHVLHLAWTSVSTSVELPSIVRPASPSRPRVRCSHVLSLSLLGARGTIQTSLLLCR